MDFALLVFHLQGYRQCLNTMKVSSKGGRLEKKCGARGNSNSEKFSISGEEKLIS